MIRGAGLSGHGVKEFAGLVQQFDAGHDALAVMLDHPQMGSGGGGFGVIGGGFVLGPTSIAVGDVDGGDRVIG